jgi:Zn-finger nucleic acid-binding protein
MRLYSVCPECDWNPRPYDGDRAFGDLDKCPNCGQLMDVWTDRGVRNEEIRQGNYGARQK